MLVIVKVDAVAALPVHLLHVPSHDFVDFRQACDGRGTTKAGSPDTITDCETVYDRFLR